MQPAARIDLLCRCIDGGQERRCGVIRWIRGAAILIRPLNLLAAGEQSARALGLPVASARWLIALLAAMLAATTTATCGIIAFVGLLVPHLGRLLVGPDHRRLFPVCLLIGPLLLITSDIIARLLFSGQEVPISILTGAFGCLAFLSMLLPRQK
jgi:iron complex transport system permease protein